MWNLLHADLLLRFVKFTSEDKTSKEIIGMIVKYFRLLTERPATDWAKEGASV